MGCKILGSYEGNTSVEMETKWRLQTSLTPEVFNVTEFYKWTWKWIGQSKWFVLGLGDLEKHSSVLFPAL